MLVRLARQIMTGGEMTAIEKQKLQEIRGDRQEAGDDYRRNH